MKNKKAEHKAVNQIYYDFENNNYQLDGFPLLKGKYFEVLAFNPNSGLIEWIPTRMTYQNKQWRLAGLLNYRLDGMYARRI